MIPDNLYHKLGRMKNLVKPMVFNAFGPQSRVIRSTGAPPGTTGVAKTHHDTVMTPFWAPQNLRRTVGEPSENPSAALSLGATCSVPH